MCGCLQDWSSINTDRIAKAIATEAGHLCIGHAGGTLYFKRGSSLSGFCDDCMKAACMAAGLPVIDTRPIDFSDLWRLVVSSPMVAVGRPADSVPWHCLSYAPLAHIAAL